MKKIFAFILALCMVFSLVACGGDETVTVTETMTVPPTTTEYVETTLPPETTTEFVPSPEAPILDFDITGFDIIEDYEGNPCLIVYLIWTNTTDETTNFWITYNTKAFQDGIELTGITFIDDTENAELMNNDGLDIRPGATIELAQTFVLRSDSPIVEVEVWNTFSFSDKPLMLLTIDTSAKG